MGHGYKKGGILKVNRESVNRLVVEASNVLDLPEPDRELGIYIPGFFYRAVHKPFRNVSASYIPQLGKIMAPAMQHEAVIFHECVHYVMHVNGMLFAYPPNKMAYFYASLMNETPAEVATASVYEYDEIVNGIGMPIEDVCKMVEYIRGSPPENVKRMEDETGITLQNLNKEFGILESERVHRKMERDYLHRSEFDDIDVEKLLCVLDGMTYKDMTTLITNIAKGNSIKVTSSGSTPAQCVSRINTEKDKDPVTAYFSGIVPFMR